MPGTPLPWRWLRWARLVGEFTQQALELTQCEAAIRASDKTPAEKRDLLDQMRQVKVKFARVS